MLSTANYSVILFWAICLLVVAGFNGWWGVKFFQRSIAGGDPMATPFLVLQIAYTNMFLCFTVIRALPLFNIEPNRDVILLTWGTLSTFFVIVGFVALQYQIHSQKRKGSRGR